MAITQLGNNLMAMTAVDDEFPDHVKVAGFTGICAGTGGQFTVNNSDDELLWKSNVLNANDQEHGEMDNLWCDGVKLASLPASGTLLVHFR